MMIITLDQDNTAGVVKNNDIQLGRTMKQTCKRLLTTVDESARIIETTAKDIRLGLELIEIQLQVAKGSAIIDGVQEFVSKGMSQPDANALLNQLLAD